MQRILGDYSIVIIIAVCSLSHNAFAQKSSAGYIITHEGDSIRGFIEEGTDAELERVLKFHQSTPTGPGKLFTAATLQGFGFDNGRKFTRFTNSAGSESATDSVILAKNVMSGKINLCTWERSAKDAPDIILINNQSHKKVQLSHPEKGKLTASNGSEYQVVSNRHIGLIQVVKDDANSLPPKKTGYSEKTIKNHILAYNQGFQHQFPISVYTPPAAHFTEVTVGTPIIYHGSPGTAFRVAAYRNTFFPEKSQKWSIIMGVSYRYWRSSDTSRAVIGNYPQESLNYMQQAVSIIPIGINFHGSGKIIRPYLYVGIGLAALIQTNYNFENGVFKGSSNDILFTPLSINAGAGVKIKLGSNYLLAEVTPTFNGAGIFANVGYCF